MASFSEFATMFAVGMSGYFFLGFLARSAEGHLDTFLIGAIDGIPMSVKHRRDKLFNRYIQWVGAIVAGSLIIGATLIVLALRLPDPGLRALGFVWAAGAFWPGATWAVVGTTSALECAKLLREASSSSA